jgi:hypothetical protein
MAQYSFLFEKTKRIMKDRIESIMIDLYPYLNRNEGTKLSAYVYLEKTWQSGYSEQKWQARMEELNLQLKEANSKLEKLLK